MGSRNATFHTHSHSPQKTYDSVNDVNTPCWGGELPVWKRGCGLDGGMRSQMEEVKHDMMHASRNKVFCFHLLRGCDSAMRAASLRDAGRSELGSETQRGHERIRCAVPTARISTPEQFCTGQFQRKASGNQQALIGPVIYRAIVNHTESVKK